MELYTLGYEGIEIGAFVTALKENGINVVVDIRDNPYSRKKGYSKNTFRSILEEAGIGYVHTEAIGTPKEIRKTAGSRAEIFERYRAWLRENPERLEEFRTTVKQSRKKQCLVCYERDPADCHRTVLLEELAALEPTLKTKHLFIPES